IYLRRLLRALGSIDTIDNHKDLSLLKRRRRIKLAADISLALTSNGSLWSHALISKISKINEDKSLLQKIIGKNKVRYRQKLKTNKNGECCSGTHMQKLMVGRRRAMKRSFMKKTKPSPYELARSLVSQRTKLLKRLIPGGESMDS
ncbi:hypothetical protein KI387_042580, partial [Taxus chinensis]